MSVCVCVWRASDTMTIRNTLRDHGQRYRPRMACLKKVGCPFTSDIALHRLYLQTHLYIGHLNEFSKAVVDTCSIINLGCIGICSYKLHQPLKLSILCRSSEESWFLDAFSAHQMWLQSSQAPFGLQNAFSKCNKADNKCAMFYLCTRFWIIVTHLIRKWE